MKPMNEIENKYDADYYRKQRIRHQAERYAKTKKDNEITPGIYRLKPAWHEPNMHHLIVIDIELYTGNITGFRLYDDGRVGEIAGLHRAGDFVPGRIDDVSKITDSDEE